MNGATIEKKKKVVLFGLVALALVFAGCAQPEDGTTPTEDGAGTTDDDTSPLEPTGTEDTGDTPTGEDDTLWNDTGGMGEDEPVMTT